MSDSNIFVSNGTCYSAAGEKLDESFIPCGNDAFGHQTCCGAGDNCLADYSCFGYHGSGYGSMLTYMAGCTDPDYEDATCPDKKIDQPWIALTLCDNSDGVWAACSQEGNPSTLQPGSYCSCTDEASATIAFSDASSLSNTCSLPQSTGDSIQFFVGYVPTAPGSSPAETTTAASAPSSGRPTSDESTQTSTDTTQPTTSDTDNSTNTPSPSSGSSGNTVTVTQTGPGSSTSSGTGTDYSSTPSPSDNSSSGLNTGAKIGIGVGVAAGVILILAAVVLFFLRRRKRQPSRVSAIESASGGGGGEKTKAKHHPGVPEVDGQAVSEADGRAATPWKVRSELEGSAVVPSLGDHPGAAAAVVGGDARGGHERRGGELGPVAELPGSTSFRNPGGGAPALSPERGEEGQKIPPFPRWGEAWRKRSR